jgi:hypothetical protein
MSFFLNPSALLEDRTPLEVPQEGKNELNVGVHAAAGYGQQGLTRRIAE